MKIASYLYRTLLLLLNTGLLLLSGIAFFNQSQPHQAGFDSHVAPANANLGDEALILVVLSLIMIVTSTIGWKPLKYPLIKFILLLISIGGYYLFFTNLALT